MIRIAQSEGWILVDHRDHARLAGEIARHWGNEAFSHPEPFAHIVTAVSRHDDAWAERDALPCVVVGGKPGGFSRELVGTYSAFEHIDLADYLRVRGRATETVARDDPFAAILVSIHTVNLLTEQTDLDGLGAKERELHGDFIRAQLRRQEELATTFREDAQWNGAVDPPRLRRAFEFLQACDSLSLIVCVRYPERIALRHRHPRTDGELVEIHCEPVDEETFQVAPWPFDAVELNFRVPCRHIAQTTFGGDAELRAAHASALLDDLRVRLVP